MSKKYLYSNGNCILIYKEGYKGNKLMADTEWHHVKAAKRQGDLMLVKSSNGVHAINIDKYRVFVSAWSREMNEAIMQREDVLARASMHGNCFTGIDC